MVSTRVDGLLGLARELAAGAAHRVGAQLPARRGSAGPEAPPDPALGRRVEHALAVLQQIESTTDALPTVTTPRGFVVQGRAVTAADTVVSSELVPASGGGWRSAGRHRRHHVRAGVAADALALAKLDLREDVKFRAHYVQAGLTVAAQPVRGRDGVLNAVRAHDVVARHAPGLCPRLRDHGELGRGIRYLVEDWVDGVPARTPRGLARAAPVILDGLAKVHRGHGVRARPVTRCWGASFGARWATMQALGVLPSAIGARVADLIAADRGVRFSWTHGDVVVSNVLRTGRGSATLLDWEHSRERPIMHDAAKLHLFAADPGGTLDVILEAFRTSSSRSGYTPAEELVLAHAHFLSCYPATRTRLQGHERAEAYERQFRMQLQRLEQTVGRAG